jgi:hypothetical protein
MRILCWCAPYYITKPLPKRLSNFKSPAPCFCCLFLPLGRGRGGRGEVRGSHRRRGSTWAAAAVPTHTHTHAALKRTVTHSQFGADFFPLMALFCASSASCVR